MQLLVELICTTTSMKFSNTTTYPASTRLQQFSMLVMMSSSLLFLLDNLAIDLIYYVNMLLFAMCCLCRDRFSSNLILKVRNYLTTNSSTK
jgi:hypothetical protein